MRMSLSIIAAVGLALAAGIAGGWWAGRKSVSLETAAVSAGLALPGLEKIETRLQDWTYPGAELLLSAGGTSGVDQPVGFCYGASHAMSTAEEFDAVVGRYRAMLESTAKARSTKSAISTVAPPAQAQGGSNTSTRFQNGILIFTNIEPQGGGAGNAHRACLGLRSRNSRVDVFVGRGEGDSRTRITVIQDDAAVE